KLRPDGAVKVLDLGLAKLAQTSATLGTSDVTGSPTITSPAMMTGVGVLLGTAAYMSPEQAKGRIADKRSDIWAFGCVLYEMLTGRRPFKGDDATEVLARIIEREPDFTALPPMTPPALRRLLRRSLEKDRNRRLADISDARLEIEEASTTTPAETTEATIAPRMKGRERAAWTLSAISLLVIGSLVIAATVYFRRSMPGPVVTRLDVVTPPTTDAF